jgi:hypothetical protein
LPAKGEGFPQGKQLIATLRHLVPPGGAAPCARRQSGEIRGREEMVWGESIAVDLTVGDVSA